MSKRVVTNSKLTNRQLNQLIKYFALEVPAARAAKAMNINWGLKSCDTPSPLSRPGRRTQLSTNFRRGDPLLLLQDFDGLPDDAFRSLERLLSFIPRASGPAHDECHRQAIISGIQCCLGGQFIQVSFFSEDT